MALPHDPVADPGVHLIEEATSDEEAAEVERQLIAETGSKDDPDPVERRRDDA
jgi:hypothetical protein